MLPKQLVILGGGASVKPAIDNMELFKLLPKIFSCGLNFAYRYVDTTVVSAVDEAFINANYQDLIKLPLVIAKLSYALEAPNGIGNCYFFQPTRNYNRDLIGGVYSHTMVGLFALSMFIKLMDEGEIYLLGYDYGATKDDKGKDLLDAKGRPITHWYQGKIEHRGIGKTNWYTAYADLSKTQGKRITQGEWEYRVYANETKVKIYNVGLTSNIPTFEKISYEQFFTKIERAEHNQEVIRKELIAKCEEIHRRDAVLKAGPMQIPSFRNKGPF